MVNNLRVWHERSPRSDVVARLLRQYPMSLERYFEIADYGVNLLTVPNLVINYKSKSSYMFWAQISLNKKRRFVVEMCASCRKEGSLFMCSVLWHEMVHAHVMLLHGGHGHCSARVETLIDRAAARMAKKRLLKFYQLSSVLGQPEARAYYRNKLSLPARLS